MLGSVKPSKNINFLHKVNSCMVFYLNHRIVIVSYLKPIHLFYYFYSSWDFINCFNLAKGTCSPSVFNFLQKSLHSWGKMPINWCLRVSTEISSFSNLKTFRSTFFFISLSQSINAIFISVKSISPLPFMSRFWIIASISRVGSTPIWRNAWIISCLLRQPSESESTFLNKLIISLSSKSIL